MIVIEVIICFALALFTAFACGYGLVLLLLPERFEEHRALIAPGVGYAALCGLSYILSGTVRISAGRATCTIFAVLALISAAAFWRMFHHQGFRRFARQVGHMFVLSSPMLLVILWPLFYVGVTYLGAVNPDYYASFKDNQFIRYAPILQRTGSHTDIYSPFYSDFGNMPPAARFGSGLFAILLEILYGFTTRTSLTIAIAVFLFCLPLSVYFMARVILNAEVRLARLCAWLTGISAPVAMSYVYFYVGQNSGLSIIPLLLGMFYIVFTEPSKRIIVLTTLLTVSLFFMYLGMVSYACAPAPVLVLYLLRKKKLSIQTLAGVASTFAFCVVVLGAGLARSFVPVLTGWANVVGQTLQGQYFTSFLTEEFLPMFFGLTVYSLNMSALAPVLGKFFRPALLLLSLVILVWLVLVTVDWIRRSADKRPVVYLIAAAGIYGMAWWVFSFQRQYGYAVFKMSSWLQFLLVTAYGVGLYRSWTVAWQVRRLWLRRLAMAGCVCLTVIVAGANLLGSVQYGIQGLGKWPERGYIVNNFEMSGNYDYLELEPALRKIVKPSESIGLAFSDSVQNHWVNYYLRKFRLSNFSHVAFPGDDENLPDPVTRDVRDYYGNIAQDENVFFHGATDDYILTVNPEHVNFDVVEQELPKPVWQNRTFQLLRATDVRCFLVTGRGFYRLETWRWPLPYWSPGKWRWASEGGEFYLFQRSQESAPYRLSFLITAGYGIPSARRHLEIWLNEQLIEELEINGAARVVTRPFLAPPGANRLVIRARERVPALPRPLALWNKHIPPDYRGLNFFMSRVKVLRVGDTGAPSGPSAVVRAGTIFSGAVAFDGIEANGWVREAARLSYLRPAASSRVEVTVLVPGLTGGAGPCSIEVDADGASRAVEVTRPGPLRVSLPLPPAPAATVSEVRIQPCKGTYVVDYTNRRPIVRTVQLQEIIFKTGSAVTEMRPPYDQLQASSVDADGWFLKRAVLKLPAGMKEAEVELEFPGWAGVKECPLDISVNGKEVLKRVLTVGTQRLRVPVTECGETASIAIHADTSFRLPSPDSRTRSLRLTAVRGAGL